MCNLRLNVSNEIPVVFHNGSNYDNKDYQKKIEGQFEYLKILKSTKPFLFEKNKKLQKSIKIVTKI